ncbi:hypothetical protein BJ742DRAFT_827038 [Cladochytrium replicatum]|nr:hypothetical protein BJ742DRAFT_827038 [Cladochytrium replicatum]
MSYQQDPKGYPAYPQQPVQNAYHQQPYGQQPQYGSYPQQQQQYYAGSPNQPAPAPTATDELVSGFVLGLLFVGGFFLSFVGPFIFCAVCLIRGKARFAFFLGAAISLLLSAIAVAAIAFAFPFLDSVCDPAYYGVNHTTQQTQQYLDQCGYIVNVYKYTVIALAVIYGICGIGSFVVAFVSIEFLNMQLVANINLCILDRSSIKEHLNVLPPAYCGP